MRSTSPRRLRRLTQRIAIVLCVLITALSIPSWWVKVTWQPGWASWWGELIDGGLYLAHYRHDPKNRATAGNTSISMGRLPSHLRYWYGWPWTNDSGPGTWGVFIPLWMPLLPLLGLVTSMWLLDHWPRFGPGRCSRCGYSFTGLAAGTVCPECGTPA
jgi:hypothetical protein